MVPFVFIISWNGSRLENISLLQKNAKRVFISHEREMTSSYRYSLSRTEALFLDVSTVCHNPQTGV